ncbi:MULTISPECIES: phosphonate ABC transporter, permease protein PhnE [Bifidobacterium]|jgi:phosphonate transport system permease protein|uniref:Phosphonate ABC transporter, permease protein PhnE n=1 Tax=Bifidobacterium tibiigranuli TaxID=2172043 RepID=A0A5N6S465_9BIFI|nr:phosphonate ABC transporter, permease protein PhnE [Bifidobacterium tibiigranuli]KAE8129154.1 phosphonate ABC transporter, permease protein PhnE [Bifidobacterium tibiigranuli]KAE8129392.1 phosphonate ABC transporter, permease protein PhnE [Bifidobacterium tibiigranuli]MCH3975360.1 phosphonate ABC transporter, permease protein PhnE [Bifidobacterium tibiigranuli]MCH4189939.1 phosphonate ABC transporter, permease protein PhnE [Bifidobacterium tibiigranuli]MCH4203559.1 phosphonate ABC transport
MNNEIQHTSTLSGPSSRRSKNAVGVWGQRISIALVALIVVACFATVDYGDKAPMSWPTLTHTFSQLLRPDWGYVYDGSGEDLVSLMLQTICIAFLSMIIATVLAFPWSFISASTLWPHMPAIPVAAKFVTDILRAFPELVYAIVFVKVVGPGPAAGVLALGVHQIGMLGKLYAESIESMDTGPAEAMESVGANFWKTTLFGRIPLLAPIFASLSLNHFEIAVRSAATLGLVGAGGIGAPLIFAIQSRQWNRVSILLLGIIVVVAAIDAGTGWLRKKLL